MKLTSKHNEVEMKLKATYTMSRNERDGLQTSKLKRNFDQRKDHFSEKRHLCLQSHSNFYLQMHLTEAWFITKEVHHLQASYCSVYWNKWKITIIYPTALSYTDLKLWSGIGLTWNVVWLTSHICWSITMQNFISLISNQQHNITYYTKNYISSHI